MKCCGYTMIQVPEGVDPDGMKGVVYCTTCGKEVEE